MVLHGASAGRLDAGRRTYGDWLRYSPRAGRGATVDVIRAVMQPIYCREGFKIEDGRVWKKIVF